MKNDANIRNFIEYPWKNREFHGIFKPKMLNLIRYNKKVIFLFGRT